MIDNICPFCGHFDDRMCGCNFAIKYEELLNEISDIAYGAGKELIETDKEYAQVLKRRLDRILEICNTTLPKDRYVND